MCANTGLAVGPKSVQTFFCTIAILYSTDFHATYKLAPASTLCFAQSPLWGLAITVV